MGTTSLGRPSTLEPRRGASQDPASTLVVVPEAGERGVVRHAAVQRELGRGGVGGL